MTPAIVTSARARTWQIARGALPALALAGGVVAIGAAGHAHADDHAATTLRVVSYNVQFVTPDLPLVRHVLREWPGHKPNVTARAEAIATRLACFDIVALQETINDQRRREMFERLESAGRDCGQPSRLPAERMFTFVDGPDAADESRWLPLVGDELALASRLPVVATGGHVYRHAAEEDMLAAKGVLHGRLARAADDLIDVFVTHLQAGQEHGAVRRHQIAELASFIRRKVNGAAHPVLVLGDFNVRGSQVDRQDPGSDYNFLRRALDTAVAPRRFVDSWLATNAEDPETASGTKPRVLPDGTLRPHEERIDYVFLASAGAGPGATPRAMRLDFFASDLVVDGAPVGHLSDHAAVIAEISWRSSAAARVAASDR
jgi:endonuclease/exonuclease/phosphatase family metal-dependent hydrolase